MILGAGFTGIGAARASGARVIERAARVGGICASYEREGFRFETGGGHWIFGGDPELASVLGRCSPLRRYTRRSAVYFTGALEATAALAGTFVPYPIQDNLWALPSPWRERALAEITGAPAGRTAWPTMADWIRDVFGPTLGEVFFEPFHERYTAGLYRHVAPQDPHKTPIDRQRVARGAIAAQTDAGYNATFLYPADGLDRLAERLADGCRVELETGVRAIDVKDRCVHVDGRTIPYERLLSTLPLNALAAMTGGADALGPADPHTAVLVLNLGVRLPDTPAARHGQHWLYVPDSVTGFHRVGYYSNVDPLFLPPDRRDTARHASLYVELAYPGATRPDATALDQTASAVCAELTRLGLVEEVLVQDQTWVDVAYTWTTPGSDWVQRARRASVEAGIESIGRYGRWTFQGIAASFKEGVQAGHRLAGATA